jgi:hypothetical protein
MEWFERAHTLRSQGMSMLLILARNHIVFVISCDLVVLGSIGRV